MAEHNIFRLRNPLLLVALSSVYPMTGIAASVGTIDFVSGSVTAVDARGGQRPLRRGSELNNGDTIRTGSGRAQARFNDGGLVSLQPQTEFRIDDFRYDNPAEKEEKGFFSLLKGGLRTITGLIGRRERDDYQIRAPFATIGIRGTEYTAGLNPANDELKVSTNEGLVEVCANNACLLLASGESGIVRAGEAPKRSDTQPLLPPNRDEDDEDEFEDHEHSSSDERDGSGLPAVINAKMIDGSGYRIRYSYSSALNLIPSGTANFSQSGTVLSSFAGAQSSDKGSADVANSGNDGIIGWGRWTNGTASVEEGSQTFSANEGLHYVVGKPTVTLPSGSASYTMIGATAPTVVGGAFAPGVVNSASLVANFTSLSVTVNLDVTINGQNIPFSGAVGSISGTDFSVASMITSGGSCGACTCTGSMDGSFYGNSAERAGMNYQFSDPGFNTVIGTVALKTP